MSGQSRAAGGVSKHAGDETVAIDVDAILSAHDQATKHGQDIRGGSRHAAEDSSQSQHGSSESTPAVAHNATVASPSEKMSGSSGEKRPPPLQITVPDVSVETAREQQQQQQQRARRSEDTGQAKTKGAQSDQLSSVDGKNPGNSTKIDAAAVPPAHVSTSERNTHPRRHLSLQKQHTPGASPAASAAPSSATGFARMARTNEQRLRRHRQNRLMKRSHNEPVELSARNLHKMFRLFDVDNDGLLSVREFQQCLVDLGFQAAEDAVAVTRLMSSMDLNHAGAVNEDEFVTFLREFREEDIEADLEYFKSIASQTVNINAVSFSPQRLPVVQDVQADGLCDFLQGLNLRPHNTGLSQAQIEEETGHVADDTSAPADVTWLIIEGYDRNVLRSIGRIFNIYDETLQDVATLQRDKIEVLSHRYPGKVTKTRSSMLNKHKGSELASDSGSHDNIDSAAESTKQGTKPVTCEPSSDQAAKKSRFLSAASISGASSPLASRRGVKRKPPGAKSPKKGRKTSASQPVSSSSVAEVNRRSISEGASDASDHAHDDDDDDNDDGDDNSRNPQLKDDQVLEPSDVSYAHLLACVYDLENRPYVTQPESRPAAGGLFDFCCGCLSFVRRTILCESNDEDEDDTSHPGHTPRCSCLPCRRSGSKRRVNGLFMADKRQLDRFPPFVMSYPISMIVVSERLLITVVRDASFIDEDDPMSEQSEPTPGAKLVQCLIEEVKDFPPDIRVGDAKYLAFLLIEDIMQKNFELRDEMKVWLDAIDDGITQTPNTRYRAHLLEFSKVLENFISEMEPMTVAFQQIRWDARPAGVIAKFFAGQEVLFRDLDDQMTSIMSDLRLLKTRVPALFQTYNSSQEETLNRILFLLTVVTAVFVPAQFLTGLWGMNFEEMPELKWKYGYLLFWILVVSLTLFSLWLLRRHIAHFAVRL